jgi:hypothetical protein
MTATLACAHCQTPVEFGTSICPGCRSPIQVMVFPAWLARPEISIAAPAMEGEAGCFYHPSKKAVVPCDQCGRFLCALCQVDFFAQNWCPNCIETSRRKGRLSGLDAVRKLYGNAALSLAVLPLLFWPVTFMTAPMSLYVTFRYWSAPSSLVRRNRWQFYAAILFDVVELGAWFWLLALLVSRL